MSLTKYLKILFQQFYFAILNKTKSMPHNFLNSKHRMMLKPLLQILREKSFDLSTTINYLISENKFTKGLIMFIL